MKVRLEELEDNDIYTDSYDEDLRKAPNEKGYYLRTVKKEKKNEKNYRNNKRSSKKEIQESFLK